MAERLRNLKGTPDVRHDLNSSRADV